MIVLKFGGTSVGDSAAIVRASEIIATRRERQPVVVVSAMAGVTDRLLDAAHLAGEGDLRSALTVAHELRERHETAINEAVCRPGPRGQASEAVGTHFAGLDLMLEALTLLREDGAKAEDAVLAHGELWSAEIMARALEARDVPGLFVDARQVMITDATFGRAVPDRTMLAERARAHLASAVQKGSIPVTQGFVGSTLKGTPTTLGRGGSDYTAALLGAALGATEVEIWTDVDGLMTADPRVVKNARTLPEASYDEAAELAYFGAKVLHPATIVPLVEHGIPVWIKNSRRPEAAGTKVIAKAMRSDHTVKSIAWKRGMTILNLRAPRMLGTHGFLKSMFEVFERHGTAVDVVTTSEVSVSVSLENGAPPTALLADLGALGELTVSRERSIFCVVGEGLRDTPGIPARILQALGSLPVEMISLGASKINLTFVVQDAQANEAAQALHREFFP
ncbi:MAG: lysine-sensitive aspartokinase 3 [Gemmatimonadetes bacterium]|nr:lysine-sensitive aspartokinase 3 [Gemmatimonadota bacterium]